MIHIKLTEDMRKKVKVHCVLEDITVQDYVRGLIEKDFEKRQGKEGAKGKK